MDNKYMQVRYACTGGNCGRAGINARENGNSYNCNALFERIRQIDFAILDATLYLDVYPDCRDAIEYIAAKNTERSELMTQYETTCGPLTMHGITSGVNTSPWPWQYCGS